VVEERGDHGRVAFRTKLASSRYGTQKDVAVDREWTGWRCGYRCLGEFVLSHGDSYGRLSLGYIRR